jgi:acyl-CoA thioester hydrolase
MTNTVYQLDMKVRDYECDMQGIVNNAVYQNYLEWARHKFLLSRGLSFAELTARGIIIVVTRAELDYRQSLRSGDSFRVSVIARQISRIRMEFEQEIRKQPDHQLMLEARITATSLDQNRRPYFPAELKALL